MNLKGISSRDIPESPINNVTKISMAHASLISFSKYKECIKN